MDGANVSKDAEQGQQVYQPGDAVHPSVMSAQAETSGASSDTQRALPTHARPVHIAQDSITWTASEFIAHQKSSRWYLLFVASALVIAGLVWLLTRDVFSSVAVAVSGGLLGYYAGRQPREQTYTLDTSGLTIGRRHYNYRDFRSFSVVPEGAFLSIELLPLKRIAMYTTMYVDPADEDAILEKISRYLPLEETHSNFADTFMRRIHF